MSARRILVPLRRYFGDDGDVSNFANSVVDTAGSILSQEILNGIFISTTAITSAKTLVAHGLGRLPSGYIITSQDAPVIIYESALRTTTYLTLSSTADVNVTLWIF